MTREEQIIKAAKKDTIVYTERDRAMFLEGAQWADEHPHWISVEEDLPKMEHDFNTWSCSKEVLVFTSIGDYCIRRWEYDKRDDRFYWTPRTASVTHWMPLPPVVSKTENTKQKGGEQ